MSNLKALSVRLPVLLIDIYRLALSGFLGGRCRFSPTCSVYAREAYLTHGFFKGTGLTLKRLGRCHPFGGAGFDPVTPKTNQNIWVGSQK